MVGKTPATFYRMKELSIFIDEPGDFGEYDFHSPYYIIAMVMHDQAYDLSAELAKLENDGIREKPQFMSNGKHYQSQSR